MAEDVVKLIMNRENIRNIGIVALSIIEKRLWQTGSLQGAGMLSEELAGKSLEVWKKKEILKKARVKPLSLFDSLKN